MAILIFFLAHWYLSLFSQTFFLHRYAAHRLFVMSAFWERFFYFFAFVTMGSSYLSARAYAVLHRKHHAYADTEEDPHSPSFSSSLWDMMWKTYQRYHEALLDKRKNTDAFNSDLPVWSRFDTFASSWGCRLAWVSTYVAFYVFFAPEWYCFFLLPIHFFMGPIHGVIINWFAHKIGYRTFEDSNTSMNLLPVDFLMMGEGYHNNHHHYPNDARFSKKWFELDFTYPFILLFSFLGIISLKK